jgi:circadian clock protein KaiC
MTSDSPDLQLHSIVHGVVTLEELALDYGAERRRLRVTKMRGVKFRGGYHDYTRRTGGLEIFPRLVAFQGIMSGIPTYVRPQSMIRSSRDEIRG